ncbi:MAG: tRNA (guanosine(37)-N1)-methyltransferase TrmD, partial [Candidatus Sumerlaeia bacterium]|nr:tRNA (guanosine(37)-N1)-methyltransferase TrmD [Candidatus Sumerlaeia bacterium]
MPLRIDILTLFPEMFEGPGPLSSSMIGRARAAGQADIRIRNIRDWTHDRHRVADDTPYGGGAGMVMKP